MKRQNRQYWHSEHISPLSAQEVQNSDAEFQKEVMRKWFLRHYENPAENTPYESREGGYIYIWGGPYDAREELSEEFYEIVPENVIDELVEELEKHCLQWSGTPSADEFDDYYYSVISFNIEFHETFLKSLEKVEALIHVELEQELQQHLLRLLRVSVITALETFLADAFINTILADQSLLRKFVEESPYFEKRKFTLSEIFARMDNLEDEVRNYLLNLIWHNLEKIKPMYKSTLNIKFPEDLKNLFKAIVIRHDIVHRNGKTKDGKEILLAKDDVQALLEDARQFIAHIDNQFAPVDF